MYTNIKSKIRKPAMLGGLLTGLLVLSIVVFQALPARAALESVSGWWFSDIENVPAGSGGCGYDSGTTTANELTKQWDYWDQCGLSVVSASAEGLPTAPNGGNVIKWHKPLNDPNVYQKVNRTLTKDNWPSAPAGSNANTGSPADVSGRYVVYQYIPSDKFHLNPSHGWVVLNEFKENFIDSSGQWQQYSTWGIGCNNFSGPITCSLNPHSNPEFVLSDYMDRWVRWEYRIYQGNKDTSGHGGRIELYADDQLVDTGYESEMHVGSAAYAPLSSTQAWVWVAGQYTSNQDTNGTPDYVNTDVTSYIDASAILPLSTLNPNPEPTPPVIGNGTGLMGTYYDTMNLTGARVNRTDPTVNFDWGYAAPIAGIDAETFSVRWKGQVQAKYTEAYTFCTTHDDGSRLWVNGTQVLNNWTDTSPIEHCSSPINLTAGQKYDIQMDVYDNTGGATAQLAWSSISNAKEIIPGTQLYPAPAPPTTGFGTGLPGTYYDNTNFTGTTRSRTDATVNFAWAGTPYSPLGADTFSVRWIGQVEAPATANYTFCVNHDDGARLWVNNVQVVNNWVNTGVIEHCSSPISMTAGQRLPIKMEMYDNTGSATAQLKWSSPTMSKVIIPQVRLYPQ
jgi:hypothetical protein